VGDLVQLDVGGGVRACVQPGAGTKVLWIHGYTLDSRSWREMWRRLPGWYHIGLDLPGHGVSAPIGAEDDLRLLGERVAAFCREQEIRHVVALSFGTLTATQAAIAAPEWFDAIVLGAPTLAGGPSDPRVAASYWALHQIYKTTGPGPEMKAVWMDCIAWHGIDELPELREELGALVLEHQWTELAEWGILKLLQPAQTEEELKRIRTPVLILIGDRDLPAFHTCADILERTVAGCCRVTLANTDHLCMLQSPEPSAAEIEAHLCRHGATALERRLESAS
jgi:2-succinyl-6-hydroxy-2,4-cyclohexadiene-1-carboxylate synthase